MEIKVAAKSSPDEKTHFSFRSAAAGQRGQPYRSAMLRTRPRRLAHILLFTRDVRKAIEFYTRVPGMRLSDHSGDNIAFLHGIHPRQRSSHGRVCALQRPVITISAGMSARSTRSATAPCTCSAKALPKVGVWARHVLGSNYFHYVQDPWGSFSEYCADIDYVPVTADWPSGDHAPDDSFYAWGPNVPEDFVHNYET